MPAAVPALIAAGGAIAGGVISSNGAKSAAKTQADAANASGQVNLDIFNKQTELQEPFRQNGLAATNRLSFLLGLPQTQGGQPQAAPSAPAQASQGNPFAPHPEIPQAQAPVTEQNFNAQAYLAANPDVAQFLQANPGSATPWEHYNQHGRDEGRSLGLPTSASAQAAPPGWNEQAYLQANPDVAAAVARGETTPLGHFLASGQAEGRSPGGSVAGQNPQTPTANNQTGFGSLNQAFSQTDFQADGAPKFAPFTQTPNLPTFNQQAPQFNGFQQRGAAQQIGQYQAPDQLAGFQSRPELGQYGGAQTLSSFKGTPDLSGFEDMPAFSADMMKDDPGYQFRLSEGLKGLDHTAAARGGVLSGAAIKGAERFGQDYASNEFGNSFNRYQTQRGNKLQDYLTNQNTDQANRANAVQDFGLNQNTAQLNNTNQLQTFLTNQNTQQANRTNAVQDYATNRDTSQLNTANGLQAYNTNRTTQQQNIDNSVRDFNDNLGVQQSNYTNQRSAYDTNFNQFQVDRTNAVNDNKDALNVYSLNRANGLQDYQAAYQRFQQNRSNVINPLLSLMGAGQTATNATSDAAQNYGNQASAAIQAAGNSRAAGQVGSATAVNGAIGSGANQLMNILMRPGGFSGAQAAFSNTAIGSSGFGTGLAYGNQDFGQNF
jgi:hypothetical protein